MNSFITNTPPVSQSGTWTVQPGNTANTTPWLFNLTQVSSTSLGTPTAYGTAPTGNWPGVNAAVTNTPNVNIASIAGSSVIGDPCQINTRTYTPINISSAVNTKIVAGTSSKKTYVCHLYLFASAADNVGIVEGTGTNCATGTAGVIGGSTAATGINLAANQGWVEGAGSNAVAATATNADDFCLITSSTAQLSGVAVTVQQ